MSTPEPSDTEWVVLRPATTIADSDMPSSFEGEWRRRSELPDESFVELLGPQGNVRGYPTDETEQDADGNIAQVYVVPDDAAEELAEGEDRPTS